MISSIEILVRPLLDSLDLNLVELDMTLECILLWTWISLFSGRGREQCYISRP